MKTQWRRIQGKWGKTINTPPYFNFMGKIVNRRNNVGNQSVATMTFEALMTA